MALNFGKKMVVGVSVTPDIGLEVAHIDYVNHKIMSYISKPLEYDIARGEVADLDIFKDTLLDCFNDLGIPQGSEVVLNLPSSVFQIRDWSAAMDQNQIQLNIQDELAEHPLFQNASSEPVISYCKMLNSTIQMQKLAYTAAPFAMVNEIAMQIRDLKYKLVAIDTSVNSTLNALVYNERVNTSPDVSWIMLIVENSSCKIVTMQGPNYVDCFEEKISIGEVLGDAENYSTVLSAINPILKNLPSQLLYVISKTSIISAKALADKITYNATIVHQEANIYNTEPIMDYDSSIGSDNAKTISLDVIGAAIRRDFEQQQLLRAPLNLFNKTLGDIYISQTPPIFNGIELSLENMIKYGVILAALILGISGIAFAVIKNTTNQQQTKLDGINSEISQIEAFLKANEDISSESFSEGDEIRIGLQSNKNIYSYYTIVGTEIPKKLWLTSLDLGEHTIIKGQADNLESVYSFYRNIKDYNPTSPIKLQKLGMATKANIAGLNKSGEFDTNSILTSLNADFYEFVISDGAESAKEDKEKTDSDEENSDDTNNNKKDTTSAKGTGATPPFEVIDEEE